MKDLVAPYLFVASMDVDAAHEELFTQIYDHEHIPSLLRVPGVRAVNRYISRPLTLMIGGSRRHTDPVAPAFHAMYEIDDPSVLVSEAWAYAIDAGRWAAEVRPFTHSRQHALLERIGETPDR